MPVDTNENSIRIRQRDPGDFVEGSFKTITISEEKGIKAVIGKLKSDPNGSTVIQTYIFDKSKWTVAEAEKWVSDHKEKNRSTIEGSIRSFETVIKTDFDNKPPKLIGLAVAYNKISDNPLPESPSIKEKIAIGAFKRSIEQDDVKLLWQHDTKYVLGRKRAGTLTLTENNDGIYFENVPPDVGWARDLQVSIKRKDISNMSFKFSGVAHYERMAGGAYLQVVDEGRLDEISIVTEPVYLSTSVYSRSAEGALLVNSKPIDIIDPETGLPYPQDINFDDVLKRYDAIIAKNEKK